MNDPPGSTATLERARRADPNLPLPERRPDPADIKTLLVPGDAASAVDVTGLPSVSVIVPTRNRARWLPYLFHALAEQVYPTALVEVVVVDNSSSDDTEVVVGRWADVLPFSTRFHRRPNNGPASSRNFGAAHSTGEVLAFTDSDCMPDPRWLLNGVRAMSGDVGLVTGQIVPRRIADTHFFFNTQLRPVLQDTGLYQTASLFVPRRVFDTVGGFDETFSLGLGGILLGGEDTDLGWRIRHRGFEAVYRQDVSVVHLATPISLRGWLARPLLAQTFPRLLRTIPELRDTALWHRYFLWQADFIFLVSLSGVAAALALSWWPPALLSLAFVWFTRATYAGMVKKGRFDKAAAILVLLLTRAALNLVVLLYASARYRRLVL